MSLFLVIIFIIIPKCLDSIRPIAVLGSPKISQIGGLAPFQINTSKALTSSLSSNSLTLKRQQIPRGLQISASNGKNVWAIEGENGGQGQREIFKENVIGEMIGFMEHKASGMEQKEEEEHENFGEETIGKDGKFKIRWGLPKDVDQIYKIYFGNNRSHLKPQITKILSKNATKEEQENYVKKKKVAEEFEKMAKKRIELDLKMGLRTKVLIVTQEMPGIDAIVSYLIFQKVHNLKEQQEIICIDDFFVSDILQQNERERLLKDLFSRLIKFAQKEKIKMIEWPVHPKMEEMITDGLGELGKDVEKETKKFSLWHLKNKNFAGHIYEKDENEKIENYDFLFESRPIYAELDLWLENGYFVYQIIDKMTTNLESESKAKNVAKKKLIIENLGKVIFKLEPYFTWSEQYAWLESLTLNVEPSMREKYMKEIFNILETYFWNRKVQGIAWIADEEMLEKFGKNFESIGATKVMNVHRWMLKNVAE